MRKNFLITLILLLSGFISTKAQTPVTIGAEMPGFTLQSYQGKTLTLSQLKGKNVMLVFPRGKVGDHWCQICHYQYAELADLEKNLQIREKYNLEIIFVLPYSTEVVNHWVSIFPDQIEVIYKWKNPTPESSLSDAQKSWKDFTRILLPKDFHFTKETIPTTFPILSDGDRSLSMKLGLFTTMFDNSYVEQNIPAIYLLDKDGKVQFKYLSQNTFDRPGFDYLIKMMNFLYAVK
jgi:peroxiredoxin